HVRHIATRMSERRRLGSLYSPDPSNLDLETHIESAVQWLKRAQDSGSDRGVSYGTPFGGVFQESYPWTTGYICRTFFDLWAKYKDDDLLDRAVMMGNWESDIQLPDGAVMGGKFNRDPTPAVFNTGMVMLGWNALVRTVPEEKFKES